MVKLDLWLFPRVLAPLWNSPYASSIYEDDILSRFRGVVLSEGTPKRSGGRLELILHRSIKNINPFPRKKWGMLSTHVPAPLHHCHGYGLASIRFWHWGDPLSLPLLFTPFCVSLFSISYSSAVKQLPSSTGCKVIPHSLRGLWKRTISSVGPEQRLAAKRFLVHFSSNFLRFERLITDCYSNRILCMWKRKFQIITFLEGTRLLAFPPV